MFIRTKDNVKIIDNNNQTFHFLDSNRKGNIIHKFELKGGAIRFFDDELNVRMIPKDKIHVMQKDIKIINTEDGNSLVYQDFDESPCRFLILNEVTDLIEEIEFYELTPEDTEILCFDTILEDYYFAKIAFIGILTLELDIDGEEITDAKTTENNTIFNNELNTLSRYIIGTNSNEGIILNNIMII